MEVRHRRRDARSVHWEDQIVAHGTVPGDRQLRHRRDGAMSAAATLNMYLSEALRDSARPSRFLTYGTGTPGTEQQPAARGRSTVRGEHSLHGRVEIAHTMASASMRPGSPLSRFLDRRVHATGAPTSGLLPDGRSVEVLSSDHKLRSRDSSVLSSSSGSMERLLREKIHEAKRMRDQPSGHENQSPNVSRESTTASTSVRERSSRSPIRSSVVPVPHPKPERPRLVVSAPLDAPIPNEQTLEPQDISPHSERRPTDPKLHLEKAVRRIQRWWRQLIMDRRRQAEPRECGRRHQPSAASVSEEVNTDGLVSSAGATPRHVRASTNVPAETSAAESSDQERTPTSPKLSPVVAHDTDLAGEERPSVSIASDEVVIQRESVTTLAVDSPSELTAAPFTVDESGDCGKTTRWLDDEWSFLEEGRYATHELLDSPAHTEDQSIEALVWTRPHMVVERQEATRRAVETTRRASAKKTTTQSKLVLVPAPAEPPSSQSLANAPTRSKPCRSRVRRKALPRLRVVRTHKRTRRQRRPSIAKSLRETSSPNEEDATQAAYQSDGDDVAERLRREAYEQHENGEDKENGVYTAMLAQLHRYVVFSDAPLRPQSEGSSASETRNDLINVETLGPSTDRDSSSGHDDEQTDTRGNSDAVAASVVSNDRSSGGSLRTSSIAPMDNDASTSATDRGLHIVERVTQRESARLRSPSLSLVLHPRPRDADSDTVDGTTNVVSSAVSPFDAAKQREFRQALDAFQQSLRASRVGSSSSTTSEMPSPLSSSLSTWRSPLVTSPVAWPVARPVALPRGAVLAITQEAEEDEDDNDDDDDGAVDAELEAMLREIQRCKEQIALARRQA